MQIKMLSSFQHPNVVRLIDVERDSPDRFSLSLILSLSLYLFNSFSVSWTNTMTSS